MLACRLSSLHSLVLLDLELFHQISTDANVTVGYGSAQPDMTRSTWTIILAGDV